MNSVNIIGNIASDILKFPVDKFNKNVVKFAIRVVDKKRQTDGQQFAHFFECEAWAVVADRIYEHCNKGDKVALNGHLEQVKYTSKDGQKRSIVKIIVSSVEFLSPRKVDENGEIKPEDIEEQIEDEQEIEDNDLPF